MDKDTLIKLARIACDAAISNGAEYVDVSAGSIKNLSVELESSAIKSCDANQESGLYVRAIYKGGTGAEFVLGGAVCNPRICKYSAGAASLFGGWRA